MLFWKLQNGAQLNFITNLETDRILLYNLNYVALKKRMA